MKTFVGHVPHDDLSATDGFDLLLTVHDDGTHEVATRAGTNVRWVTWSHPVVLEPAAVTA